MGKFGHSYPPGCSGPPDDTAGPCDVCGGDVDSGKCICRACDVCGAVGNPWCYTEHGMVRTQEQVDQMEDLRAWQAVEDMEEVVSTDEPPPRRRVIPLRHWLGDTCNYLRLPVWIFYRCRRSSLAYKIREARIFYGPAEGRYMADELKQQRRSQDKVWHYRR